MIFSSLHRISSLILILEISRRTSRTTRKPLIDKDGGEGDFDSCYVTTSDELGPLGNIMEITLNLGKSFFVHSFLVVQDEGYKVSTKHDN